MAAFKLLFIILGKVSFAWFDIVRSTILKISSEIESRQFSTKTLKSYDAEDQTKRLKTTVHGFQYDYNEVSTQQ